MINKNMLASALLLALAMQTAHAQNAPPAVSAEAHKGDADDAHEQAEKKKAVTTLDEISVSDKFVELGARSAMKQDIRVLDTPYSVASYSGSFMKAIETTNIADLYNYMTGIRRGGSSGYDLSIRGFKTTQADSGAILVDGMPGLSGRFGSPPTFAAEHIEVVKGPASVLYGQAQPGGFVNIVSKKPMPKATALLDIRANAFDGAGLSLGDASGYNLDADFTGPIDAGKRFLYRVVAESTNKDTFRGGFEKAQYLAPSVTWNITDSTPLTLALEYRHRELTYDNLLVAPGKNAHLIADIKTRYQEPGDRQEETGYARTLTLTHYFESGMTLNAAFRSVDGKDTARGYDNVAVLADLVTLQRRARQQANKRTYNYFDGNLSIPFNTGPLDHKLLVGVNGGVGTTDFDRIQFFNGATTGPASRPGPTSLNVNIYHPVYGVSPPLSSFASGPVNRRYTRNTSGGIYVSDLITLSEHWKASLGLRYAREKQYTEERKTPPLTSQSTTASDTLPTFGLMYQPSESWTIYTSYATSFVPQAAGVQDAAGNANPFSPQSGKQVEAGVKAEVLDNRLTATLAVFDIKKDNTLAPISCNKGVGGTCSQQVGAERSKGAELEVNYRPIDNLQIIGGIAYTDAVVDKSYNAAAAPLVGARLTNSALKSANLWTRYDFDEGALKDLSVGLGVYYSSAIAGSLPSRSDARVLTLPSYVVADLALYYKFHQRYDFTLKFGNLFDRRYFEGVNSTTNENGVVPGAPRNVTLSLRIPLW